MGVPQTPSPPQLYPQALQLKLYQAFIFSIPILFSIILFLLFYLFYLKSRASTLSASPPILPRTLNQATLVPSPCGVGLKGELKSKLPIVLFDEELRAWDSECCVCLGEFEIKEELHQVPSCKHVFHVDCIHHWLRSNFTCPLCRCSVVPATSKLGHPELPTVVPNIIQEDNENSDHHPHIVSSEQEEEEEEEEEVSVGLNLANFSREPQAIPMEGSSRASNTCLRESGELSICIKNEVGYPDRESVVLHTQTHNS